MKYSRNTKKKRNIVRYSILISPGPVLKSVLNHKRVPKIEFITFQIQY